MLRYPASISLEKGALLAEFPDCPGCQTFAGAGQDIAHEAQEALEGWLETHLDLGEVPPPPSAAPVAPAGSHVLWVEVTDKLAEAGTTTAGAPLMPDGRKRVKSALEMLGLPDHLELELKASLVGRILELTRRWRLSRRATAKRMGIPVSKLSKVLCARLNGISVADLMRYVSALGQDVALSFPPARKGGRGHLLVFRSRQHPPPRGAAAEAVASDGAVASRRSLMSDEKKLDESAKLDPRRRRSHWSEKLEEIKVEGGRLAGS